MNTARTPGLFFLHLSAKINRVIKHGTLSECLALSDNLHDLEKAGHMLPYIVEHKWLKLTDHIEGMRSKIASAMKK